MKILYLLTVCLFNYSSYPNSICSCILIQKDSITFKEVEERFNSLMDTTNLSNYKKFKQAYRNIIELTSSPGEKIDFTKFDSIYIITRQELQSKVNGFYNIIIPMDLPDKIINRLEESKNAFIYAYSKLMDAVESLSLHSKERFGFYLSDYNNYMLEFEKSFNKGIIKFAQAKIKIK